ncbi:MAG: sulfatase-like hydrolase/transferase [Opitutaceae bacterium]|nr:sulfatase-like hydrolase/transferase [Opitutaceae bacterium]
MKPVLVLLTLLGLLVARVTAFAAAPAKPNIIVFYTDDHGYADLGIQGVVSDIKTPHVDALARSGVRAKNGYTTAPQCVPSRAGLMTGKFQSRFGVEANGNSLDGFNQQTTIATRLQQAGYATAQFGKWHLGATDAITTHGFKHVFAQNAQRPFSANITLDGQDRPMGDLPPAMYHVDGCSRAAATLIERYKDQPFFLYVAYRAPHVPLDAPKKYLDRFPGQMPQRRLQALAMLSAVDDGVGLITAALKKHGLTEKTLIFYIGDNGAPLKIHKTDAPGGGAGWDGSLNTPLNGEKGMLSEGGMHTPFVIAWPGTIPAGQSYEHPVSTLDVAATAAALAGIQTKPGDLEGVNLVPHLKREIKTPPHEALYWRWVAQAAIRQGNWKLLRGGNREYLYDLGADLEEKHNLAAQHPDIAARLRARLTAWTAELKPPGLATGPMAPTWNNYFDFYLEGKPVSGSVDDGDDDEKAPKSKARARQQKKAR